MLQGEVFIEELSCEEKKIAGHLPLLLDHSISFSFSLHTNYFIAWCMEIPVSKYILFKLTTGDHQEIFCFVPLWKAVSRDNYIERLEGRNEEEKNIGQIKGNPSRRESFYRPA